MCCIFNFILLLFVLSYEGKSPNSRKNQKQVQKSTAERGARQNSRGGRPEPVKQVKDSLHNASPIRTNDAQQICIVDAAKEVDSLSKSSEKVQINGGRENQSRDRDTGSIKGMKPRKMFCKKRDGFGHTINFFDVN